MADNVQALLDMGAPPQDLDKARWAIFYSISNTQPGLRGISFGNFLLKRVIERLLEEVPKRSEEHTSELQSLMRSSYAVFCLKKKKIHVPLTSSTTQYVY